MSAFTIVRFRALPEQVDAFERTFGAQERAMPGLRRFVLVKTGDRSYCSIGEFDSFDSIVAARPTMRANLDQFRHHLEAFSEELGVTDPVSGEAVLDVSR
jgi:hypothetical protein